MEEGDDDADDYDESDTALSTKSAGGGAGGAEGTVSIKTSRPRRAKQAKWRACCVTKNSRRSTCKKIRVGRRWTKDVTPSAGAGGKRKLLTLPRNPLRQIGKCQCLVMREHVALDMRTRPNRRNPQHVPALFPVNIAIAARVRVTTRSHARAPLSDRLLHQRSQPGHPQPPTARRGPVCFQNKPARPHIFTNAAAPTRPQPCISNRANTRCTKKWMQAGAATITCSNGMINVAFRNAPSARMDSVKTVAATCESALHQPSTVRPALRFHSWLRAVTGR